MIIDLATVKQYLGITDSTYDTAIALHIPDVDSVVKDWMNRRFNDSFSCSTVLDSDIISIASIGNTYFTSELSPLTIFPSLTLGLTRISNNLEDYFRSGDYISGTGITTGSYITDVDSLNRQVTISTVATATGSPTLTKGFNRMYNSIVANIVWYKLSNASTQAANQAGIFVTSKSQGPASASFDLDRTKLFRGIPIGLLEGLPRPIKCQ